LNLAGTHADGRRFCFIADSFRYLSWRATISGLLTLESPAPNLHLISLRSLTITVIMKWDAPYVLDDPIRPFKEHLQLLPKRTGGSTLTLVFPVFLCAGEAI
jgi:hypothetical protein